jgi:hypothetical protein
VAGAVGETGIAADPDPGVGLPPPPPAADSASIRVAHWNLEHGNRFEAIARSRRSPMAGADLIT